MSDRRRVRELGRARAHNIHSRRFERARHAARLATLKKMARRRVVVRGGRWWPRSRVVAGLLSAAARHDRGQRGDRLFEEAWLEARVHAARHGLQPHPALGDSGKLGSRDKVCVPVPQMRILPLFA